MPRKAPKVPELWRKILAMIRKEYPNKSFKDQLQIAKKRYQKNKKQN